MGSQDWSYDYTGTLLNKSKKKAKPKHKVIKHVAKKPVNHYYLTKGKQFKVITGSLNGYKDPEFTIKNGNVLSRNSLIHGQILRFKGYTCLDTSIGWFSTNTKYLKAVK